MNEVGLTLSNKPANFVYQSKTDSFAIELIMSLLSTAIKENKIISVADIKRQHVAYCIKKARLSTGYSYFKEKDGTEKWRRARTADEWLNYYHRYDTPCLAWFKRNLGEAILRGRILALPVIDVN